MMGRQSLSKSSFHKLYLIDQEMYNRILPHLSEVDKQDLYSLNNENSPDFDSKDEVSEVKTNELLTKMEDSVINQVEESSPPPIMETNTAVVAKEVPPIPSIAGISSNTKVMKPKKYACSICVSKFFTTKHSLKRHHKSFHEEKQVISQNNTSDIVNNSPTDVKVALKRKSSELLSDDSERSNKLSRYIEPETFEESRGLKRERTESESEPDPRPLKKFHSEPEQRGIKRKALMQKSDTEPRKKFHWTSFS